MSTVLSLGTTLAEIGDGLNKLCYDMRRAVETINIQRNAMLQLETARYEKAIRDINDQYNNMQAVLVQYTEAIEQIQGSPIDNNK